MEIIQDILNVVLAVLKPVLDIIMPFVKPIAIALVALLIFHLFFVRYARRWKDYEHKRSMLKPQTWFKIQPRHHFLAKAKLMRNRHVRELYAPTSMYTRDLNENEKMVNTGWLTAYPRAIRATIRDANLSKGKKLLASKQINEVADRVQILSMPDDILVGNGLEDPPQNETEKEKEKRLKRINKQNQKDHFRIVLDVIGEDPSVVQKICSQMQTQLNLKELAPYKDGSTIQLSFLAHKKSMLDILTQTKIYSDLFEKYPAKNPYAAALGLTSNMYPYIWETHHTIILGQTGSGKGSPLQAIIMQMAPFVKKGLVELYGIDPKNAELRVYKEWPSKLFKRISAGMDDDDMREHAETLAILKKLLGERSKNGKPTNITPGQEDDGREFEATLETPLVVFPIDEFPTLVKGFEQMGRDGKKPLSDLAQLIMNARSFGIYIVAATQRGDKAILDAVIDSMVHKIVLRHKNPYFNNQFLGDDYLENGCDPAKIPASTKNNGYASAGIGYVADESGGQQTKVRFAYTSKKDIAKLVREFRELDGLSTGESEMSDYLNSTGDWVVMPTIELEDDEVMIPADAPRDDVSIEDYLIEDSDFGGFGFEEIEYNPRSV